MRYKIISSSQPSHQLINQMRERWSPDAIKTDTLLYIGETLLNLNLHLATHHISNVHTTLQFMTATEIEAHIHQLLQGMSFEDKFMGPITVLEAAIKINLQINHTKNAHLRNLAAASNFAGAAYAEQVDLLAGYYLDFCILLKHLGFTYP